METSRNRLAREASLYLKQHAGQPVDWYPWGEEALEAARAENKPIFLSVGYAACHWCHVMAEECFNDAAIARKMNAGFINIKVDREERPDVDALYMKALVALTGQGGWPMSVFLTPEGEPYLAGTYFPPAPRGAQPGFGQVLDQALQMLRDPDPAARDRARSVLEQIGAPPPAGTATALTVQELMDRAVRILSESYDEAHGGFGAGMKFPEPMVHELLLRHWWRKSANDSIMMVDRTLTRMAEGGVCDQLGGGFHRYATDRQWRVPHFEKMLYNNALLARLFLRAHQATEQELYQRIPHETFAYLLREMISPEGGFYASQAAHNAAGEGGYYLWEMREVLNLLGPRHAQIFARAFGITSTGNFRGRNVPRMAEPAEKIAASGAAPIFEVGHILKNGRQTLLAARAKRPAPARDDKILTGWNGMVIGALALGYAVLGKTEWLDTARRTAEFLWQSMRPQGTLLRVFQSGEARGPACLEDQAWLLDGLAMLFEVTGDVLWLDRCQTLADEMMDRFWDDQEGGFFMTAGTGSGLPLRLKEVMDEAVPSANATAAGALLRLGRWTHQEKLTDAARRTLAVFRGRIEASPAGCAGLLSVLDDLEHPPIEIVLSGPEAEPEYQAMRDVVWRHYRPNQLPVLYRGEETAERIPWAAGRGPVAGRPTAYVCKDNTCRPPVHDAESLYNQLGRPPHISLNIFDADRHMKDIESCEQTNFLNAMSDIFKFSGLGPGK